ncbi:hypothetical protein [Caudoviricetes sp.]|nr:hypothetical protein [Caudoviricetes sp.]
MKYKGAMWEGEEFEIKTNEEISETNGSAPCKHCGEVYETEHKRFDGSKFTTKNWVCPFVVVARNEGGFATTGICLQCIIEHGSKLLR